MSSTNDNKFMRILVCVVVYSAMLKRVACWRLKLTSQFLSFLDEDSYLVDPASSHMLVSKIKPCMSKYKQFIL